MPDNRRRATLRVPAEDIVELYREQYAIPEDAIIVGIHINFEDETVRIRLASDSFNIVGKGQPIPWLKTVEQIENETIKTTLEIICCQEDCKNIATKKFNWPGQGWKPACPGCVVKAQGVAAALGMDLVVQDL